MGRLGSCTQVVGADHVAGNQIAGRGFANLFGKQLILEQLRRTPSPNLPDLEEEDLSEPVVTLQAKAKALRRRVDPRPDSAIGGGASSSGAFPATGSMFPFAVLAG